MAGFENTSSILEKRKTAREIEARAESDELPAAPIRRERALKQLLRTLDHPGIEPREKNYAAKVLLDHSPADADPLADLAKRLGSDKAGLLEWMRGNVATLEAELAKELPAATPAGEPSLPPTPPARAEDVEPR